MMISSLIITNDDKAIVLQGDHNCYAFSTYCTYKMFELEDILNAEDGTTVSNIYNKVTNKEFQLVTDNNMKLFGYDDYNGRSKIQLSSLTLEADISNVIGLKYKGDYFYRQDPHILTAGQPDVRAGKTFIGWMGTQEVGTMEVDET